MICSICDEEITPLKIPCIGCGGTGQKNGEHWIFWTKKFLCWYCGGAGERDSTGVMEHFEEKHPDLVEIYRRASDHYHPSGNWGGPYG